MLVACNQDAPADARTASRSLGSALAVNCGSPSALRRCWPLKSARARPERLRVLAAPAGQSLGVRAVIRHGTGVFSSRW
jgi:phage tail sheath protein FI